MKTRVLLRLAAAVFIGAFWAGATALLAIVLPAAAYWTLIVGVVAGLGGLFTISLIGGSQENEL